MLMSRPVKYWVKSEQGNAVSDLSCTTQTLPDLVNFRLTQSLKENELNSQQSETRAELFLTVDECGGRTQLGNDKGGGTVMLRQIRSHCV
jgi:hypothetical protein